MPQDDGPSSGSDGFVFAATGERYTTLARRAVRTLRAAMPAARVDLFTDRPIADDAFDRIHTLADDWFRPKMAALKHSRFDRTLYLDADILVLADISNVFELLKRFDIVGSHGRYSNSDLALKRHTRALPPAFAQINSGVLGVRRSPAVADFMRRWEDAVRQSGARRDQPALRELLWETDLRLYVLPRQYNMNGYAELRGWTTRYAAPRVIHAPVLHRAYSDRSPETPFALREVMSRPLEAKLRTLVAADRTLADSTGADSAGADSDGAWAGLPRNRLARGLVRALARFA